MNSLDFFLANVTHLMPLVTKGGGRRKREGETGDKGRRGELAAAEDALPFLLLSSSPCTMWTSTTKEKKKRDLVLENKGGRNSFRRRRRDCCGG